MAVLLGKIVSLVYGVTEWALFLGTAAHYSVP